LLTNDEGGPQPPLVYFKVRNDASTVHDDRANALYGGDHTQAACGLSRPQEPRRGR